MRKAVSFVFPRALMFPETMLRQDVKETKPTSFLRYLTTH